MVCWGEPPDSNLLLDILCDRARVDLLGLGGKGIKNLNPRVQILHIVYETPLAYALTAEDAGRYLQACLQKPFKHNLCGVHADLYQDILRQLLGRHRGVTPNMAQDDDSTTLVYPMDAGDQLRLILFDEDFCPDWRTAGK